MGTDIIPEGEGKRKKGSSYNPVRGELVIARVAAELDEIVPLSGASHADVTEYKVTRSHGQAKFEAATADGRHGF